jgi:hypothetical protein
LNNLANQLAGIGQRQAALDVYADAIRYFPAAPATSQYLAIDAALFQHRDGQPARAVRELIAVANQPASALVELRARAALRGIRAAGPALVDDAWQEATGTGIPGWLAVTPDRLRLVTDWLSAPTWQDSLALAERHAADLLAPATDEVLAEIALADPDMAAEHRTLLEAARTEGFTAAYRPALLADSLRAWMGTATWEDSRTYLAGHLDELSTQVATTVLGAFAPSAVTLTHAALLHLVGLAGIDTAYRCLTDRHTLNEQLRTATDPALLHSVAILEGTVHGDELASAIHLATASVLTGSPGDPPTELDTLAATADPADRNRLAAELTELLARHPEHVTGLSRLLRTLLTATG